MTLHKTPPGYHQFPKEVTISNYFCQEFIRRRVLKQLAGKLTPVAAGNPVPMSGTFTCAGRLSPLTEGMNYRWRRE
jgi:hypothetical protein